MITNQKKGLLPSLSLGLFAGNGLLMCGLFWLSRRSTLLPEPPGSNLWPYAVGLGLSLIYLTPQLDRQLRELLRHDWFTAIYTAIRFTIALGFAFLLVYFFRKDVGMSRFFLLFYLALSLPVNIWLLRLIPSLYQRIFSHPDRSLKGVMVAFADPPADLREYVDECWRYGVNFTGYFAPQALPGMTARYMGTPQEALDLSTETASCALLYAGDYSNGRPAELMERYLKAGFRLHAYTVMGNLLGLPVRLVQDGPINLLAVTDEPLLNPVNKLIKRGLDILVSLPVVFFILPPLLLVAGIMQSRQAPGPVLYRQNRYGYGRQVFKILKLRTMRVREPGDEARQATDGDDRVFPFGSFLRKTSLDEFPQFLNVLLGDMSIIGPRPHLTDHDDQFEKDFLTYRWRHFVKPGITGYAQIHGFRGEITQPADIENRIRLDLHYVNNWTPLMDLKIFFNTIRQVIRPPKTAK